MAINIYTPDRAFKPNVAYVLVHSPMVDRSFGYLQEATGHSFLAPSGTAYEMELWAAHRSPAWKHAKPWGLSQLAQQIKSIGTRFERVSIYLSDETFSPSQVYEAVRDMRHWDFVYCNSRPSDKTRQLFTWTAIDSVLAHAERTSELPCVLEFEKEGEKRVVTQWRVLFNVETLEENTEAGMKYLGDRRTGGRRVSKR